MAAHTSASSQQIETGHEVGDYVLGREIGKGSFAVVYEARRKPRRPSEDDEDVAASGSKAAQRRPARVAIKVVTRKKLTTKLLENLEGEISIMRTVRHANIVELFDCLKTSSHIYLIMEYCQMGDLSNFIRTRTRAGQEKDADKTSRGEGTKERPDAFTQEMDARYPHPQDGGLNDAFTRSFLAQLAGALQFMRGKNIVHRDIKPQNLLLQEPEPALVAAGHPEYIPQVKVADFGFARHLEQQSLAETLCGSPLYMAPEILRYEKYDAKADLWSVGAVLFEMCIGKPPFRAVNHVELLRKIERGEDRIKFPDERSDESLKREHYKRVEEGRAHPDDYVRPHEVPDDLKELIRALLKRHPVERLGFKDFFDCKVLSAYKETMQRAVPEQIEPAQKPARDASRESSRILTASRPAPAVPKTEPQRGDVRQPTASPSPSRPEITASRAAPAAPRSPPKRPYFAPRYVVGGMDAKTSASPRMSPARQEKTSTDGAARASSIRGDDEQAADGEASSLEDNALETPGSSVTHSPVATASAANKAPGPVAAVQQGTGSKPGSLYDEERGYVMVDKKSIDVNAVADDDAARLKQPSAATVWTSLGAVRRPAQLGRLASLGAFSAATAAGAMAAVAAIPGASPSSQGGATARTSPKPAQASSPTTPAKPVSAVSTSPSQAMTTPTSMKLSSTPPGAPFALPRSARRPSFHRRKSQSGEGAKPTSPLARQQLAKVVPASAPAMHPDRPSSRLPSGAIVPPANPSSALSRAISMASIRLFGVPTSLSMRPIGSRRLTSLGSMSSSPTPGTELLAAASASGSTLNYSELNLLSHLQDFGQKSFVLSEFADAKLSAFFPDGPHQHPHAQRSSGDASQDQNDKADSSSASPPSKSPSASAELRSTTSAAQTAASEALVLYVRSLSFLQRGIDIVREYVDAHGGNASRYGYGAQAAASTTFQLAPEISDTVQWLHAKFDDGVGRATFARSKSADELPETAQHVDKMIYDKALEIARTAALDELQGGATAASTVGLRTAPGTSPGKQASSATAKPQPQRPNGGAGWNVEQCLLAYETANSMLMGLLDAGEGGSIDLSSSAVKSIDTFARSITARIAKLQQRYQGGSSIASAGASATVAAATSASPLSQRPVAPV